MDLLERDQALAALTGARDEAARGRGRVAFVSGEPGIGKTSLVNRFVQDQSVGTRVLVGTCDDLSVPRPLGAIRDLSGNLSAELEQALASGAASHETQGLLLAELERAPRPTILVLEDVHWADDATLDAITVLGRRIGSLPALLVLTFRGGETPSGHPLRAAIGAIRADESVVVELAPLSELAVAGLAGVGAAAIYAASRGNPFYVAELLASDTRVALPASIANAVLGRVARLTADERGLLELVSVVPNRIRTSLLDVVLPGWTTSAEEPERQQLLDVAPAYARFRHELARHAVRSSIPQVARRRLHAEIVAALLAADADPADIVHHAEAAGDEDVVAGHVLVAARRARAVGSNREAYSHYARAADFVDRLSPREAADIFEELAEAAYGVDRIDEAVHAIEQAIGRFRELGDDVAVGRCTRLLSRLHWYVGSGALARETAREAIAILEPLGETIELAQALSGLSQLAMLADDAPLAIDVGERALALATRLGDDRTRAHAVVTLGSAQLQLDPTATAGLLEAHAIADAAGDRHEAARALINLAYSLLCWVNTEQALEYGRRGLAYAEEHEVHTLRSYVVPMLAWLELRTGRWDEVEHTCRSLAARGTTVSQLLARTVLAELAVRRGDADATALLADLAEQAERTGELQRIAPVIGLEIELALTGGGPLPLERLERLGREPLGGWSASSVVASAALAGIDITFDGPMPAPHAAMRRRDWRAAADAFGDAGWTYDRALMLSFLDDERALGEAVTIARELGAEPLRTHVTGRLRELGFRVPQGRRETTRANPAGLTARQLAVLALIVEGLTNAEIAERLVVSPRTAEHHVAAVLRKLGATTRREAARRAAELGVSV